MMLSKPVLPSSPHTELSISCVKNCVSPPTLKISIPSKGYTKRSYLKIERNSHTHENARLSPWICGGRSLGFISTLILLEYGQFRHSMPIKLGWSNVVMYLSNGKPLKWLLGISYLKRTSRKAMGSPKHFAGGLQLHPPSFAKPRIGCTCCIWPLISVLMIPVM